MHSALLHALAAIVPAERLFTDDDARDRYAHDDAEWAPYVPPIAVVLAETTEEVAAAVRAAADAGVAVVPRGAGTGLSGGANGVAESIVISLERMTAVLRIDADERYAIAEAA